MPEPGAAPIDPLLQELVADALRRREHRPTRMAVVGCGGRALAAGLQARHPHTTVVTTGGAPSDRPSLRLVAEGPFDLIVVCPETGRLDPVRTLVACRCALVDRGLAVAESQGPDDPLALAAAVAGFDVETHTLPSSRLLTVMRP